MPRPQKTPLRPLTADERATLAQVARSSAERADRVGRAKALLAVADGATFAAAAHSAGRRSGDGVAKLVARFNASGVAALTSRPGGRPPVRCGPDQAARIAETSSQKIAEIANKAMTLGYAMQEANPPKTVMSSDEAYGQLAESAALLKAAFAALQ